VHLTYVPGDRRDFFVAETALRKIVAGVLREQIAPHFNSHEQRLAQLGQLLEELPPSRRSVLEERMRILQGWPTQARAVFPAVMATLKSDDEGRAIQSSLSPS
jgi:DNA-binding transcriptional regulator GbsR (MarR family)